MINLNNLYNNNKWVKMQFLKNTSVVKAGFSGIYLGVRILKYSKN